VKDKHVKDAAQDVAQDAAQDVAQDVLGAAEDRGAKVLVVARVILQRRNIRPTHACRHPRYPWATSEGRARERAAQDVAEGVAEDVPQDAAQDLALGARAARALLATPPPPLPPSMRSS